MESRAAYGYYGEGHGVTGEEPISEGRGGFRYNYYRFIVDWSTTRYKNCGFSTEIEVKAKNYTNALKQLKAWQKRDGFVVVRDKCERQKNDWQ